MVEMRDYKQDIEIDESDLEGEWITHPSLYLHYSEIYADACANKDDAKLRMEWIAANIDLDVRKNWNTPKYDLEKLTEGVIKSCTLINKKYMEAYKKYNKCVKIVNSMTGVKTAFEHRKHALGNLVSLKIGGFNAEPRNKIRDISKLISSGAHDKHKKDLQETMKERRRLRERNSGELMQKAS